ncbi:MAG TPA: DedA family protein [Terriglobales bacterium]|nr:DedA family protein [Terriglobales bacterium]
MHNVVGILRQFLLDYGYWAVALALLAENTGVPVPGETILILASVFSYNTHELRLPWIIVVATLAATAGDNLGYWIGRKGGRPLLNRWKHLFRVQQSHIDHAERLIHRHGSLAIFFARFIAGARIIAGPLAGVLCMHWPRFAFFNFLGALVWVSVISTLGYLFGSQLDVLLRWIGDTSWAILAIVVLVALFFWWKRRRAAAA